MQCTDLGALLPSKGDSEEAMKWVNNAVSLYPAEAQVYINRALVQEMLGKYRDASDTYLVAMSATNDNGAAISRLFDLSAEHYDDVMASLRSACDDNPRVGIFYRVRSAIALNYKHYGQALRDLKAITDNNLMEYSTIYNDEATCSSSLATMTRPTTMPTRQLLPTQLIPTLISCAARLSCVKARVVTTPQQ